MGTVSTGIIEGKEKGDTLKTETEKCILVQ